MDTLIWVGLALIALALSFPWWRRARPPTARSHKPRRAAGSVRGTAGGSGVVPGAAAPTVPAVATAAGPSAVPAVPVAPLPTPDWPVFRPWRASDWPAARQRELLAQLVAVPRPPRLLDQLLSSEFINQASARQLADLVAGEPLLAARVLKAVNAPFYGLPQPVHSIAQAVTFLGLTSVRITCLRYIFITAFQTSDARRQQAIDQVWRASALASELVQRAAASLSLADAGRWSSAVLLSFLGRLVVLASAPPEQLPALCSPDPVARAEAEQDLLGLCAAEVGRLRLSDWGLPPTVVGDAVDLEWLLFEPVGWPGDGRGHALVLSALCVRLSERAVAPVPGGPAFDFDTEPAHDIACLRARLDVAQRQAVWAWLATPAVQALLVRDPGAT